MRLLFAQICIGHSLSQFMPLRAHVASDLLRSCLNKTHLESLMNGSKINESEKINVIAHPKGRMTGSIWSVIVSELNMREFRISIPKTLLTQPFSKVVRLGFVTSILSINLRVVITNQCQKATYSLVVSNRLLVTAGFSNSKPRTQDDNFTNN